MAHRIIIEKLDRTDPRLGRHIRHDSRSLAFPVKTAGVTVQSVTWERTLPILNQGNVGSCTANAALGVLGTAPFTAASQAAYVKAFGSFDEAGALKMYSAEETMNGDGPYPPQDNGSDGLTAASVLLAAGCIAGYNHAFTLDDTLKALQQTPLMAGMNWYNSMFSPNANGIVTVDQSSGLAGGHEPQMFGFDVVENLLWFYNSWGPQWGLNGTFAITTSDFTTLLSLQGDVTQLLPLGS